MYHAKALLSEILMISMVLPFAGSPPGLLLCIPPVLSRPIFPSLSRTLLSALQSHRMNAPLLPFVFDALASLIVGNQVR